ncbi:MAG TPA: LysR substrate-binding domain-containing protein [Stenomitos sp.]
MELRHLRYFLAVAEELHFGRAAERLNMAQPPLSKQIRDLEQELGIGLFRRTKRHVALTAAGSTLQVELQRMFAQLDHAVLSAQRASRGEIGRLRLGFVSSAAYHVLPAISRAFRAAYPDVVLELHEQTADFRPESLLEGTLDIGLYRVDLPPYRPALDSGLRTMTVLREPLVVAMADSHRLAGRGPVDLAQLAADPWILIPAQIYPGFHAQILRLCRTAGFTPRVAQEAFLIQTIVGLVAAGIGVAIVPGSLRQLCWPGVAMEPIRSPEALSDLVALWRQDEDSPVVSAFLRTLERVVSCDLANEA